MFEKDNIKLLYLKSHEHLHTLDILKTWLVDNIYILKRQFPVTVNIFHFILLYIIYYSSLVTTFDLLTHFGWEIFYANVKMVFISNKQNKHVTCESQGIMTRISPDIKQENWSIVLIRGELGS